MILSRHNWLGRRVKLSSPSVKRSFEGTVRYGIKEPMAPGGSEFIDCESGRITQGRKPTHYVVSDDNYIKVALPMAVGGEKSLKGMGYDVEFFRVNVDAINLLEGNGSNM
tara:strand:- start:5720 stop:6049 length:330 start_codon:yes stop_codon:yes gene_type:complete